MERIMSTRDLSTHLVERFRRDGVFRGYIRLDKGELIIPIGPDFIDAVERAYDDALALGHTMDSAADRIASMSAKPQPPTRPMTLPHSSPCSIASMAIGERLPKMP